MARPADRRTATTVEFGRRVRTLREGHGLTQERLAFSVGLSVTYVASVERGERNIGLTKLLHLSDVLNVSPGELLEGLPRSEAR